MALQERGVSYLDARAMDVSTIAAFLVMGDGGTAAAPERIQDDQPLVDAEGNPAPATSTSVPFKKVPKFWRGDRAAFASTVQAMEDIARPDAQGAPPS